MKANWRLAVVVLAAFVGGVFGQCLLGRTPAQARAPDAPNVVRAEAFVLVDADGRGWPRLGMPAPQAPALTVRDAEGRARLRVGALTDPAGYGVNAHDAEERTRTSVAYWADSIGGMRTFDAEGVKRLGIGVGDYGCGMSMVNADGVQRLGAGVGPQGGGDFILHDWEGEVIWRASWTIPEEQGSSE
jgi:hypothetical protein